MYITHCNNNNRLSLSLSRASGQRETRNTETGGYNSTTRWGGGVEKPGSPGAQLGQLKDEPDVAAVQKRALFHRSTR